MPRKSYPPEFKQETASLVLDQGYTRKAASEAMGVGYTALDRWVKQLRQERQGETPEKSQAMTATQREIQALKVQVRRLEREKAILKKATALLMSEIPSA
jgi:transposase